MTLITELLPANLTQALGWTLLHSLWQGALVALLLSLTLVALRRASAQSRYRAAGAALLAQLLLAAGTFTYYLGTANVASQAVLSVAELPSAAAHTQNWQQAIVSQASWLAPLEAAQAYVEQHLPLLVACWLLGMLLMAIRLTGGFAYAQRLRHEKAVPLGDHWQQKLAKLAQGMGLQTTVRLMESALVQVPMAIGIAKPVILLPIGAVTGLRPEQVEAVLAHELAHILRKDYLVNLLQTAIDTLFFYHPAMWWVSGVMRAERENCCDDMAIALCGDTLTYARTLAQLAEMRLPAAPSLVVAFPGKQGTLLNRIKRLVGAPAQKTTAGEGIAAAIVLVIGFLALSFGAVAALKPQLQQDTAQAIHQNITSPLPASVAYTAQDSLGNPHDVVIIQNKKGKLKELYVDGKRIPKKHQEAYEDLVRQRLQAVENASRASKKEVVILMDRARDEAASSRQHSGREEVYHYEIEIADGDSLLLPPPPPPAPPMPPAPGIAPPLPPMPPALQQQMERYEIEIKAFEEGMQKREKEIRRQETLHGKQHQQEMAAHEKQMAAHAKETERRHEAQFQRVRAEMVKDGIIKESDKNLQIQFKNDEFYVNDKKQSKEMAEKYKKLMQKEPQ
ncbi:M56 family metallopeptidase [Pontibacter sp. CAU 1760]